MAELDLNSLFGQDPRLLQQAMDMQMAKASPEERLYMMGAQGGRALGQGIGSLFGVDVQDPMMKKAAALRALASEFDISTPDGLEKYAQAASKIDTRAGFLAGQQAREMRSKQAAIAKDEAAAQASLAGKIPPEIQKAQRIAILKAAISAYEAAGDKDTTKRLQDELDVLQKEKTGAQSELGKLLSEQAALDPVKNKAAYDAYSAKIKKLTTGKGIGGEIAEGLGPILGAIAEGQSKRFGEVGGGEVAKNVVAVEGKYTAKYAVDDALDVLKKGIYAGGYGPMQEAVSKYTKGVIGSPERLANTEEFRAYIGNVVIPRLQEFGGNDSVEELKYLRSVMAGETTMEPTAIKNILEKASKNIERGIQRLERQRKEIQSGKPLSTGPVGGQQRTTKGGVTYTVDEE